LSHFADRKKQTPTQIKTYPASLMKVIACDWMHALRLVLYLANLPCVIAYNIFCRQNTITNTEKLLVAADELAQTGECDPQEIFSEARQLEERMNGFLLRVERQRHLLDLSVALFTHIKEVHNSLFIAV